MPSRLSPRVKTSVLGALALFSLAGCASEGTSDNPVERKLSWFSYLNGDDLRTACRPGSDDRFRLIFNGRYDDQVRIYDVALNGGRPEIKEKVLTSFIVNQGFTLESFGNRLSGQDYTVGLSSSDHDRLWSALEQAGAFKTAERGTRLPSNELWWTVTGCHQGQVFFQVWPETQASGPPSFALVISSLDPSGLPFPSSAPPAITSLDSPRDRSKNGDFIMEVGDGGFVK